MRDALDELYELLRAVRFDRICDAMIASGVPMNNAAPSTTPCVQRSLGGLKGDVQEIERTHIMQALEAAGHNQTRAAKLLHISRGTLAKRMRDYGVKCPRDMSTP